MKTQLLPFLPQPAATGRAAALQTPVRALRRRAEAARGRRRIRLLLAAVVSTMLLGCTAALLRAPTDPVQLDAPVVIDPWPAPRTALASAAPAARSPRHPANA